MWQNLLDRHDDRVQVLRHFPTKKVVRSHPCDAVGWCEWSWYYVNDNVSFITQHTLKSTILLFWSFQSFNISTHVHSRGPILLHGNTTLPFSAASPPSAGRLGWARRQAWSRSRARQGRSEPRSPPPRRPRGLTGGPDGTRPEREPRHSGKTDTDMSVTTWLNWLCTPEGAGLTSAA